MNQITTFFYIYSFPVFLTLILSFCCFIVCFNMLFSFHFWNFSWLIILIFQSNFLYFMFICFPCFVKRNGHITRTTIILWIMFFTLCFPDWMSTFVLPCLSVFLFHLIFPNTGLSFLLDNTTRTLWSQTARVFVLNITSLWIYSTFSLPWYSLSSFGSLQMGAQSLSEEIAPLIIWQNGRRPELYRQFWHHETIALTRKKSDLPHRPPTYGSWDMLGELSVNFNVYTLYQCFYSVIFLPYLGKWCSERVLFF